MIALDWGTSSLRAWRIDIEAGGAAIGERRESDNGIGRVPTGGFERVLMETVGDWIAAGDRRVLLSGMIGSRQGWHEAPYLPCPAGLADLAFGVVPLGLGGLDARIVPGLSGVDTHGTPEVMRGEEIQVFGAAVEDGIVCLPGSHSKWARVAGGRIAGFETHMTGEAFAALRDHTILGRLMLLRGTPDQEGFDAGLARAGEAGGLLHHLFGARTLPLTGRMPDDAMESYLSGLLIGHEVAHAMPSPETITLIGAAPLCALYAHAIERAGGSVRLGSEDAAAAGLARLGGMIAWQ